jgi:hypothetical protein
MSACDAALREALNELHPGIFDDEPIIDPDCRDQYKHGICVGGPCECPCHSTAPNEP